MAAAAFLFWAVPRVGHFFGSSQKDALVAQENETGVPVDNESARAADESSDQETGNRQVPSGKVAPLPPPEEELPPGKTEPISGRGRAEAATSPPGQDRDLSRRSPTPKAEEGKGLRSPSQDPEMKQPATKDGGDAPLQQPAGVLDPIGPGQSASFFQPGKASAGGTETGRTSWDRCFVQTGPAPTGSVYGILASPPGRRCWGDQLNGSASRPASV